MNIKEAEKLSGVSSRNIRFYEQKGLLKPARNEENDYREYAQEEIYRLKLIRALRMVDMPLEQIKQILDGQVSLQTAAAEQRQKIKDQIQKLETAIYFCEELAKPDQTIEEVLMRMDEPNNRKLLSKQWNFDYAELAKKILLPLGASILPAVLGGLLTAFYFILLYLPKPLGMLGALILPAIWTWFGYRSAKRKTWTISFVLAHILPTGAYILHRSMEGNDLLEAYTLPMTVLQTILTGDNHFSGEHGFFGLAVYLGCFCLGGLLFLVGKGLVALWQYCYPEKTRKTMSPKAVRAIRIAAVVLPVLIVLALTHFGSAPKHLRPDTLEKHLRGTAGVHKIVSLEVDPPDGAFREYHLDCCDALADVLRFDQWKRINHKVKEEPLCTLWVYHGHLFDGGYFLEMYSDGYVRIHRREDFRPENAYYQIPPEVLEELIAYAENDHAQGLLPSLPSGKG